MKSNLKKLVLTGIAAASMAAAAQAQVNVSLVTAGGNASIKLVQDRLKNVFGLTVTANSTNNLLFVASGTWGNTNITWNFNFTGGAGAIEDISSQTPETLEDGIHKGIPVSAISAAAPEDVAIDSTPFQQDLTLVVPVVFVKNPNNSGTNDLLNVTNLTEAQAILLETSGGGTSTSFYGGTNTTTPLYFVGRNDISAVRQLIDLGVSGAGLAAANFTTNAFNSPIPYNTGAPFYAPSGASSGGEVTNIIKVIPNSIGTVAAQDIGGLPTLSYNGVGFSITNVLNGTYPLWGYERYIYYPSPDSRAPTANQLSLIQALESAVTNSTYESTSSLFIGKFVSFNQLQNWNSGIGGPGVSREDPTDDGSLIAPGALSLPIP